jgi:hypothetical protein
VSHKESPKSIFGIFTEKKPTMELKHTSIFKINKTQSKIEREKKTDERITRSTEHNE